MDTRLIIVFATYYIVVVSILFGYNLEAEKIADEKWEAKNYTIAYLIFLLFAIILIPVDIGKSIYRAYHKEIK